MRLFSQWMASAWHRTILRVCTVTLCRRLGPGYLLVGRSLPTGTIGLALLPGFPIRGPSPLHLHDISQWDEMERLPSGSVDGDSLASRRRRPSRSTTFTDSFLLAMRGPADVQLRWILLCCYCTRNTYNLNFLLKVPYRRVPQCLGNSDQAGGQAV